MDAIQALEETIGTPVPDSLKHFFLHSSMPVDGKNKFIRMVDNDFHQTNIVTKFWDQDGVLRAWNNMKGEPLFMEEKILPFAETLGSAVVCIGIDESNHGAIFIFDYDFFNTKLASSLEEFLDQLF